jgi:hypothetical protein
VSDTRFTLLGIALIFVGFIVLGIFGPKYFDVTIQAQEFDNCYEYFDDRPPVPIDCDVKLQDKAMFSGLIVGLIGAGIASLVKGIKGKWDQDVKPEDMVGPGGPNFSSSDDSKSSSN